MCRVSKCDPSYSYIPPSVSSMALDADNISFRDAKTATELMVLWDIDEHVCVGPMPPGSINIVNLPIPEHLIYKQMHSVMCFRID